MANHRLFLCGSIVAAVVASRATSQPDAPNKNLPFAGQPPPRELQVLAFRVGQWKSEWQVGPTLKDKQGYTAKGQATGQWLHNGHFLRMEGTSSSSTFREESSVLYGYDAKMKVYRRWLFSSNGLTSEAEGQWDATKRTMTWKAVNLAPNVTGTITEVVADDRVETKVLYKRDDGQVLTDITIISTRTK